MVEKFDIIIVGAGVAGITAMTQIRETNSSCSVLVINGEDRAPYKRTQISKHLVATAQNEPFSLLTPEFYEQLNIDLRHDCVVKSIHKSSKEIELDSGQRLGYGKLILATGSTPFRPVIPGTGMDQVAFLRTAADTDALINKMPRLNTVLVYGTGVQGVELAEQLSRCGKQVTLVGIDSWLMQKHLNITSARTLKEVMEQNRVTVYLQTSITEINLLEDSKFQVKFSNGLEATYDFVEFAVGIRPHIDLAKAAGLDTNRGITVNAEMKTSDPHIFAAGECAQEPGKKVQELWHAAEEQGRIAGLNALGGKCLHDPKMWRLKCEPFHGFIFSLGKPDSTDDTIRLEERMGNEIYQGFYFRDEKLVGCVMTGDKPRDDQYVQAVQENWSKDKVYADFSLYPY